MKKNLKTITQQIEKLSEWEAWILNNWEKEDRDFTPYDYLCELAVTNYSLDKKDRHVEFKDELHYFLIWWNANRLYMKKYKSKYAIGGLLKKDHSTVIHYIGTEDSKGNRKPSNNFTENTQCIKDFLKS